MEGSDRIQMSISTSFHVDPFGCTILPQLISLYVHVLQGGCFGKLVIFLTLGSGYLRSEPNTTVSRSSEAQDWVSLGGNLSRATRGPTRPMSPIV